MAIPMENLHKAILPDFMSEEFTPDRLLLVNDLVTDEQASQILTNLWNNKNLKDRQAWNGRIAFDALAAQEAEAQVAEEATQRHKALADEEALALQEECKKHQTKYAQSKTQAYLATPSSFLPSMLHASSVNETTVNSISSPTKDSLMPKPYPNPLMMMP
ncbi:hypothetical protein PAXRUDRAFT_19694 [Paxillus rubicundulus Ve08.2h10]|uniref:Uncharacterized protein n=1 Tax=Paxillus rubicundulus Ve08.2h10 TaxID=930991 RepID=A0A0D0CH87_9AGAM|nr:hypothetical protein PAXRUDRAFT_19694 [Paxillus rubicundulus Ve08.2h10]